MGECSVKSVIGQALEQVQGLFTRSPSVVFSYHDNFTWLWQFDTDLRNQLNKFGNNITILWDRTPADPAMAPIDTGKYLTPLEWSVCACRQLSGLQVKVVEVTAVE